MMNKLVSMTGFNPHRGGKARENFKPFNFVWPSGAIVEVKGPSGSGKTTLLDTVAGVVLDSAAVVEWSDDFFETAAYVPQQPAIIDEDLITNVRFNFEIDTELIAQCASKIGLRRLLEVGKLGENGSRISGGEKQRVSLLRALLSGRRHIILDEIFAAQDLKMRNILSAMVSQNFDSVLFVSHVDVELMDRVDKKGGSGLTSVLSFITTAQSPHFEDTFSFAKEFDCPAYFDLISDAPYRHDFTWRSHVPFRLNLSRKLRNSRLFKKIPYSITKYKRSEIRNTASTSTALSARTFRAMLDAYIPFEYATRSVVDFETYSRLCSLFHWVNKLLQEHAEYILTFDKFLVFNGRLPCEFMVCDWLKLNGRAHDIIFHENNGFVKCSMTRHHSIHDLAKYSSDILAAGREYKIAELKRLSVDYFDTVDRLNEPQTCADSNIVSYFTNSPDEYSWSYANPIDQVQLLFKLCSIFEHLDFRFIVRVHPNVQKKSLTVRRYWDEVCKVKFNKTEFVHPSSSLNTLDLIQRSRYTVSAGSSVCAQSWAMSVPHLLIGNQHFYADLPFPKVDVAALDGEIFRKFPEANQYTVDQSLALAALNVRRFMRKQSVVS